MSKFDKPFLEFKAYLPISEEVLGDFQNSKEYQQALREFLKLKYFRFHTKKDAL